MDRLITNTNVEILCDSVVKAASYQMLYINTNAITVAEANQIFGDEEATSVLRVIDNNDQEIVYNNYTELYSITPSIFYPYENEIAILLVYRPVDLDPTVSAVNNLMTSKLHGDESYWPTPHIIKPN